MEKTCPTCQKVFYKPYKYSKSQWNERKFCKQSCKRTTDEYKAWFSENQKGNKYNLGKKLSEETKRKISEKRMGFVFSEETRKRMATSAKKAMTPERRKKISDKLKGRKLSQETIEKLRKIRSGINSHFWRGGVTKLNAIIRNSYEAKIWRNAVFARDSYTCQKCGQIGGRLNADHIKPFALILYENNIKTFVDAVKCNSLWQLSNGRTLCYQCHLKTLTYGAKTRDYIWSGKSLV